MFSWPHRSADGKVVERDGFVFARLASAMTMTANCGRGELAGRTVTRLVHPGKRRFCGSSQYSFGQLIDCAVAESGCDSGSGFCRDGPQLTNALFEEVAGTDYSTPAFSICLRPVGIANPPECANICTVDSCSDTHSKLFSSSAPFLGARSKSRSFFCRHSKTPKS